MLGEEFQIVSELEIQKMTDDVPQIRINRTGIFGADVACIGIDIELNQPACRLKATHDFQ